MTDSSIQHLKLEEFHKARGARFVPFAGWHMPVQYTSIIQEHMTVRKRAGLFDVSHMGEVRVAGKDAVRYLNHLLTNSFDSLQVGRSRYALMCAPDGGVVDDLIVYRLEGDEYLVCVNASNRVKDVGWMKAQAAGFEVEVEDQSDRWGLLALQGPDSEGFLQGIVHAPLTGLKRFAHLRASLAGVECIISRTGYTGGDGFEIYFEASAGLDVICAIDARAELLTIPDFYCGLGCRDSLRLEGGLPLYGHEISETIDPVTAGLDWAVKFNKPSGFVGSEALAERKRTGLYERVVYYTLDDRRIAREGDRVFYGDKDVGRVLAGSYSPVSNKAIGSALVGVEALRTGSLHVNLRGNPVRLVPTSLL